MFLFDQTLLPRILKINYVYFYARDMKKANMGDKETTT